MTKELSGQEKQHIIDLYYAGYTQPEIHKITNRAVGAISKIIKNHYSGLSNNEKEEIIASNRALRKAGISPDDVINGARTYSQLKKHNLGSDELIGLTALVDSEAKNQEVPPKVLLQNSYDVIELSKSLDVPIEELPEHCRILTEKYQKLKEKHQQSLKETQESDDTLKKALKENDTKLEDLSQFGQLKAELLKRGYDSENINHLVYMIQNADSEGYNIEKILERISKEQSYNDIINEKDSEIKSLDYTISAKQKEIKNYEKTIAEYEPLLDTIRQFKTLGLDRNVLIQILTDYLVKCQSGNLSNKDALQYLQEYVSETADIAKLKEYTAKLKHEISILESSTSEKTTEKAKLDGKIRALKKQQTSLESQCNTIENDIVKWIEKFKEVAESCIYDIVQNTKTQLGNMANAHESHLHDMTSKAAESHEKLKESALSKLLKFIESDAFQNLWMIKTIKKMNDGKADLSEIRTLAIMFSTYFDEAFKKKGIPARFTLKSLVEELLDFDILDKQ